MRIILDQNLPASLVRRCAAWRWVATAGHVSDLGWSEADDRTIWNALSAEPSIVLTKDKDFASLSATLGFPPKVVLVRLGNCTAREIEQTLDEREATIQAFATDASKGLLLLDRLGR